jgi:hypothetical protein
VHALHLPPRHLWRIGLLALGLTLALLVIAAILAPTVADLSTPSVTTTDTAVSAAPSTPAWVSDPLAPPSLLQGR